MAEPAFSPFDFLPYLLNQAAETASRDFQKFYRDRYGMLRTEWRVMFHLGCYGVLSATEICKRGGLHKTKVSRAVQALEQKRFLSRQTNPDDRRLEVLSLTRQGKAAFKTLESAARDHDFALTGHMTLEEAMELRATLRRIAGLPLPG